MAAQAPGPPLPTQVGHRLLNVNPVDFQHRRHITVPILAFQVSVIEVDDITNWCSASVYVPIMSVERLSAPEPPKRSGLWRYLPWSTDEVHQFGSLTMLLVEFLIPQNVLPRFLIHSVVNRDDHAHIVWVYIVVTLRNGRSIEPEQTLSQIETNRFDKILSLMRKDETLTYHLAPTIG